MIADVGIQDQTLPRCLSGEQICSGFGIGHTSKPYIASKTDRHCYQVLVVCKIYPNTQLYLCCTPQTMQKSVCRSVGDDCRVKFICQGIRHDMCTSRNAQAAVQSLRVDECFHNRSTYSVNACTNTKGTLGRNPFAT